MDQYLFEIIIIPVLTILSAFFSGSETALFSLGKSDLHRFSCSKSRIEKSIARAMDSPQKILITILIGNLFVNLLLSMIMTALLLKKWENYGHLISIAIVTPVMLIFGEITPKIVSINMYKSYSKYVFPLISLFHKIFFPLRWLLLIFTNLIVKIFNLNLENRITQDELGMAIRTGEKAGVIDFTEGQFINNIMMFSQKDASNIMYPRNRAFFISSNSSIDEAVEFLLENNITRVPVYKENFDHVIGMLDSRDLLSDYLRIKKGKSIKKYIKKIDFYPASKDLNSLLDLFLLNGMQIAIVLDEYGGTAGVVTLNGILAELMGKKFRRWETNFTNENNIYNKFTIISGDCQIIDFNYQFSQSLQSINSDTIGGYIIEKLSTLPEKNKEIVIGDLVLKIKKIKKNSIEKIEVLKKD